MTTKKNKYFFNYDKLTYFVVLSDEEFRKLNVPTFPTFISDEQFERLNKVLPMTYIEALNNQQKENIQHILNACDIKGITNKFTKAAILSVVSKESNFIPKNEIGYSNTPNDRIRLIFGSRVKSLSDDELTNLKQHPEQFFDTIYGGRYGNTNDEGYKYRGRGFNQLTFKDNYKKIASDIGIDIVSNPELMNNIEVSSLALVQYFYNAFKSIPKGYLNLYKTDGINGFEYLYDAVNCIYHANAGWGKSPMIIQQDKTGGLIKAKERSSDLLNYITL